MAKFGVIGIHQQMLIFEAQQVSTTTNTLQSLRNRWRALRNAVGLTVLSAGVWTSVAAQKVNDLPGGPAVNQLNFAPPVTKIAEEQHWLHWFMMAICAVIFVIVFGVMF